MGKKQSKRTKKFQASGGVKKRIENGGTITKHGKLRKSRSTMKKESSNGMKDKSNHAINASSTTNSKKEHHSDGFITGSDNAIGKLDLDTFFDKLSDHIDENILQDNDGGEDDEDEIMSDDDDDDDQSNDDDADDNDEESEGNGTDTDDDNDDDSTEDIAAVEAKMKQQLEKMEQSDPDFHKFLKDNEKSLLEFGDDDSYDGVDKVGNDDDDMDEDDEDEDDALKNGKGTKEAADSSSSSIVLTTKLLEQLSDTAFGLTSSKSNTQSGTSTQIKALKSILVAYNCACHLSDPVTTNDGSNTSTQQRVKNNNKYTIESSKVFDDLMVLCLQYSGITFRQLLLPDDNDEDNNNNDNDAAVEDKTTTTIASEKPIKPNSIENSIHYSNIKPLIVMFYNSTIHLLSVGSKDPQLLSYVLRSLSISIPLLSPFPRTAEQLLKALVSLWCTSAVASSSSQSNDDTDDNDDEEEEDIDSKKKNERNKKNKKGKIKKSKSATTVEEDYQQVRLNAFFRIRQLALSQPYPFLDSILKKVYLAYAKRSKFSNTSGGGSNAAIGTNSQLSIQIFLCNCIVELYSIDYHSAYQHAFVYIRQLALLLRTAIQKKTIEDIQNVYCYQYFECCTVWTKLLCSTTSSALKSASNDADSELMKSLVYPLVEILYGIVRFTPQPIKYIPSRFYIIRLLQQLASCTTTFIPTSSLLLDCFDYKELYMSTKKHNTKQNQKASGTTTGSVGAGGSSSTKGLLHIQSLIRLPGKGDYLRYYEQIEPCMKEIFVLLQREIELYKYSAGFPEFAIRIQVRVKQYLKAVSSSSGGTGGKNKNSSNNSRYRVYAKGLLDSIETYTKQALIRRSTLQESPKDVVRLECLLRPNEKTMMERHEGLLHAEQQQYIDLYQLSTTGTIPTIPVSSSASKIKAKNSDKDVKKKSQINDPKKKLEQKQNLRDDDNTEDESDDEDSSMNDAEQDSDKETAKKDIVNKNKQKIAKNKINNKNKKTKDQPLLRDEDLMKVSDHVKEGIEWSDDDDDSDDDDNDE